MSSINSFDDLHSKVKKIFNNPNINFFIIMCLIFLISCYTVINTPLRFAISSFISNPVIILFGLIIVILVGFYNINIAILILLLLFIMLFGASIFNSRSKNNNSNSNSNSNNSNSIENFTDDTTSEDDDDNDDDNDEDNEDDEISKLKSKSLLKEESDNKTEEQISSIKNVILGTVNKYKKNTENELEQGIVENRKIILNNEKKINKSNFSNNSNNSKLSNSNTNKKSSKEDFKTVEPRKFNPGKEEDTNLLITKEILTDMINRTEYNYESTKYLKKYLKHRIEEIVEMNKLLDDDD